jgi:hypothetical protein
LTNFLKVFLLGEHSLNENYDIAGGGKHGFINDEAALEHPLR